MYDCVQVTIHYGHPYGMEGPRGVVADEPAPDGLPDCFVVVG